MEETTLQTTEDDVMERADEIMDNAVEVAGQMLSEKPQVAEIILRQLLKCDPEHLSGLQLLGLCKHRMGQNAEAVEIIQTVLELDPTNADNWNNLGLAYGGMEQHEKAIECLKKAHEYNPQQFLFLNNMALQYRSLGNYDSAVECLLQALDIKPFPQMMLNLGGVFGEMKDLHKSKQCFEQAIAIDPEYAAAHVDLAFAHCLEGNWEKGFEAYEHRFDYYPQMIHYLKEYDQDKRWDGCSLEGKKLLIYCEQGFGDAIQYIRYVPKLNAEKVYVHCAPKLAELFENCEGVDQVFCRDIVYKTGDELPEYDYQCAIMSLPHLLKDFEISGEPYIEPATREFKNQIKNEYGDTFNIGISWAGSPAHPHDLKRSIPLKHFQKLESVDGVQLFSLQFDVRKREYGSVSYPSESNQKLSNFQSHGKIIDYCEDCEEMKLVDLTSMIQDFNDTATVLAGLDLVICCDTALAHLAGAMGVPCWVLLPYNPDWRWKIEGDTTEWYDSLRLFRQEERDDWSGVFERVKEALDELLAEKVG
jgi:tetratricopeptide (TPR) repeat protein